ncbi:lysophospholipid acyltransferase family protein [Desulfosoma caldarium]|uniref:DUF374 domain-containing protein n=1 Tax=Desulfosoma caldarium TaxID=610254 RepID=A0A3N1UUV0_9BACT|nr:lysophospholipid acyltransferase family protein [Desulfosoma caldarium]ROQ92317.1 hypothetical protein EDC27_2021 [Desulfosoma caldarium]
MKSWSPDHPLLRHLPCWGASLLSAWHRTCRFHVVGKAHLHAALNRDPPGLLTTWHFAFPSVLYFFRHVNGILMVSRSQDGEWAARLAHCLGFQTVRGSSHRGGAEALRAMLRKIQDGYPAGLIADGSQGPPLRAQKGIVWLASVTGLPLVPLSLAADAAWRLPSWDRTLLPKPFARLVIAAGNPIHVPRRTAGQDLEPFRRLLETRLHGLTELAQECVSRAEVLAAVPRGGGWAEGFHNHGLVPERDKERRGYDPQRHCRHR